MYNVIDSENKSWGELHFSLEFIFLYAVLLLFGPRCAANKIINRCGHGVFHTCEVDMRVNLPPHSQPPNNTLAYITCTMVISPGSFITWMREGLTPYAHLRAHWNHLYLPIPQLQEHAAYSIQENWKLTPQVWKNSYYIKNFYFSYHLYFSRCIQ